MSANDAFPILRGDIVPADAASFNVKVKLSSFITDPSKTVIAQDALDAGQMAGMPVKLGWDPSARVVGTIVDGGVHMGTCWAELTMPRPDDGDHTAFNMWNSIRVNGHGAYEFAPSVHVVDQGRDDKLNLLVLKRLRVDGVALGAAPRVDGHTIAMGIADEAAGPIGLKEPNALEPLDHQFDGREALPAEQPVEPHTPTVIAPPKVEGMLLINPAGADVLVPYETVDALIAAGWQRPPEPWTPGPFG